MVDYEKVYSSFFSKVTKVLKEEGIGAFLFKLIKNLFRVIKLALWDYSLLYLYFRFFKRADFTVQNVQYQYFYALYNTTYKNERAVEIPYIRDLVAQHHGKQILEVGNVLSHYMPVSHVVLDKFEKGPGVIQKDIVDYTGGPFDLIISISTLEHVGWDDDVKDPKKVLAAISHLQSLLADGGNIYFTVPLGYNPHLDELIREKRVGVDAAYILKRVSRDNRWEEVSFDEIVSKETLYGSPYHNANWLYIGVINK